jgi:hypothetical protein
MSGAGTTGWGRSSRRSPLTRRSAAKGTDDAERAAVDDVDVDHRGLGKQPAPTYWTKPSAKAQRVQEQLEKYPEATALEVEDALNEAAQQDLVITSERLVSVNAPAWLHIKAMAPKIISPKPKFAKLD